jgi:riboflavin synthase
MFTGLVAERGRLLADPAPSGRGGVRMRIGHSAALGERLGAGASLAVAGVCLTVVELAPDRTASTVEMGGETLRRTTLGALRAGSPVNLEPPLQHGRPPRRPLGPGARRRHRRRSSERTDHAEHSVIAFALPEAMAPFVVEKGSVALDGVSLTVASLDATAGAGERFTVWLIPHTLEVTTLGLLAPGHRVNFEADVLAKYVARSLGAWRGPGRRRRRRRGRGGVKRAAIPEVGQRLELLLPEPDRLWIRYSPRNWPAAPIPAAPMPAAPVPAAPVPAAPVPSAPVESAAGSPGAAPSWLDLAGGGLGPPGRPGARELELPHGPFDDLLYLPPVAPSTLRAARDRAAAEIAARGTPVLVQLLAGESPPDAAGVVALYDLLEPLMSSDLGALSDLPAGAATLWPLVAGLTDSSDLREEGVRRLAEAGVAVLQAVAPDLPAADRRRLFESRAGAEIDTELFAGLFHAAPADPRPLARAAPRLRPRAIPAAPPP